MPREATDRRIHVEASRDGEWMTVRRARSWAGHRRSGGRRGGCSAFGKSAQESAETAPGVGLGLALCRRLARQLGGRLEVAGAPGGGATVTLLSAAQLMMVRSLSRDETARGASASFESALRSHAVVGYVLMHVDLPCTVRSRYISVARPVRMRLSIADL